MSPKNPLLIVGLSALGVFVFVDGASTAAGPADAPAAHGPSAAPERPATPSVLLQTNGRLLRGKVVENDDAYVVQMRGGEIRVPKYQAIRAFDSIEAVYQYKVTQVPENDPDEHLKLARWCLSQNLRPQAMTELKKVVELSPSSTEAKSMLTAMETSQARPMPARPPVDPGVVQTAADMADPIRAARPANEINPALLMRARRELGVTGLPVIFDLPAPVAVKRADLFARNVHPILQAACARCHNERHDGEFQLIEVKSRRNLTAGVLAPTSTQRSGSSTRRTRRGANCSPVRSSRTARARTTGPSSAAPTTHGSRSSPPGPIA